MKFVIVIPAYNEEAIIGGNLKILNSFLFDQFLPEQYRVVVVDNASADRTGAIVKELMSENANLEYIYLDRKGKGLAIKSGWEKYLNSDFEILVFMDADLATDLSALPTLLNGAMECDLSVGNRFAGGSKVQRSLKRHIVSQGYRILSSLMLRSKIDDLACGFKAIKRDVAAKIIPMVQNQTWFFDHELAHLCEKNNFTFRQIPVCWRDPRDSSSGSRINIINTSLQFLRELNRLRRQK